MANIAENAGALTIQPLFKLDKSYKASKYTIAPDITEASNPNKKPPIETIRVQNSGDRFCMGKLA